MIVVGSREEKKKKMGVCSELIFHTWRAKETAVMIVTLMMIVPHLANEFFIGQYSVTLFFLPLWVSVFILFALALIRVPDFVHPLSSGCLT